MCGIAGIFGNGDRGRVAAMVAAMHHRGPDHKGVFSDGFASVGMSRLAIIDLTPTGHQPMSSPGGKVHIVYNGEIYNYRELRREQAASGWRFVSESDTEVILALYHRYGDDCVHHLRGMFAFAIYDQRDGEGRERLLLARDHLGIKPLLIAQTRAGFVFASELKALLASGLIDAEIDPVALRDLLAHGSIPQPRTMLAGVRSLLPAHRMVVTRGGIRLERYWSLAIDRRPDFRAASHREIVEAIEQAIEESVRLHLVADVPVGAFLSGGIDSSLLVAIMARNHTGALRTYSVGYPEAQGDIDETGKADEVARFLGTIHERVEVTGADVLAHMPRFGAALDQPSVDGINSYFVCLAASKGLKVALSGTGGDELFAGYPWFRAMNQFQVDVWTSRAQASLRQSITSIARQRIFDPLNHGRFGRVLSRLRELDFLGYYGSLYRIFGATGARDLIAPDLRGASEAGGDLVRNVMKSDELPDAPPIERVTALCLRGYTQNQLLRDIDAISMSHSLEVRIPFLDPVLVGLALSLPAALKLGPQDSRAPAGSYRATGIKRVLIELGQKWLPRGFDARSKHPFTMPFDDWLRGPLKKLLADSLSPARVVARGFLDPKATVSVLKAFEKAEVGWPLPWLLLVFELWCQHVLDQVPSRGVRSSELVVPNLRASLPKVSPIPSFGLASDAEPSDCSRERNQQVQPGSQDDHRHPWVRI